MEKYEISNSLNHSAISTFVARKSIKVNNLSGGQHFSNKNRFENSMLESNLCGYSDAYIVVKRKVTVKCTNDVNKRITLHLNHAYQKLITRS